MRLVLIDKLSNRVCGDTSTFASSRFEEWEAAAAQGKHDLEGLATIAARLLDESLGKACQGYRFYPFDSRAGGSDGYFVFDCDCAGDRAPPVVSNNADPDETICAVMTGCFYVGYVRCEH